MKYSRYIKGFTLAELMVVVGLIAILTTLILINVRVNKSRARDNVRVADIQTIRLALEEYRAACGVFPATLDLTANNTRNSSVDCPGGVTLRDFIPEIPTAPQSGTSQVVSDGIVRNVNDFNGYFYAAISTRPSNGPCFEYHLAAELENAEGKGETASKHLDKDHDFTANDGKFGSTCGGSVPDFGNNAVSDDALGLYDFRSTNQR